MLGVTLQRALSRGLEPVGCDDGAGRGDELDLLAAEPSADGDALAVQSGRDGVAVALVPDQAGG